MDKQKQIEEMAKDMLDIGIAKYPTEDSIFTEAKLREQFYQVFYTYAEYLCDAGYSKIPEGAVVLTRKEYQRYLAYKIIEPQIRGCLDRERELEETVENLRANLKRNDEHLHIRIKEIARKETAEKFAERLKKRVERIPQHHFNALEVEYRIDEIAKEFTGGKYEQ